MLCQLCLGNKHPRDVIKLPNTAFIRSVNVQLAGPESENVKLAAVTGW